MFGGGCGAVGRSSVLGHQRSRSSSIIHVQLLKQQFHQGDELSGLKLKLKTCDAGFAPSRESPPALCSSLGKLAAVVLLHFSAITESPSSYFGKCDVSVCSFLTAPCRTHPHSGVRSFRQTWSPELAHDEKSGTTRVSPARCFIDICCGCMCDIMFAEQASSGRLVVMR